MKSFLQSIFEYMGHTEHFKISVALIAVWALFWMIVGLGIAWVIVTKTGKKNRHDNSIVSFDDLGIPTDGFRRRKIH
jgi:hypothetical protein